MSDYVPQEVLFEILLRVPVKSLLRCRCVCKSWYSLISNPDFISNHTKRTALYSTNTHLVLRRYASDDQEETFTLHYDDDELFGDCQKLDFPFKSSRDYFHIVGSCNGVLCLIDNHTKGLKPIVLWNISIGLSVTLPLQQITYQLFHNEVLGFGFDSQNNDYKVVRIVYSRMSDKSLILPPDVEIFELSNGAWRIISPRSAPNCVLTDSSTASLNGAVHWVGYYNSSEEVGNSNRLVIALFDMTEEVFEELNLPDGIADDILEQLSVTVFGRLLSVIQYKRWVRKLGYHGCCIWVMNEYGVAESWTKLLNIDFWSGLRKVLGLRNNGEVLLVKNDGELVSHDPWSKRSSKLEIHGESSSFFADTYMETLVLLKGKKRLCN
ncbi:hypothetical protein HS088_TW02G00181 [Tripterygium wilfordii]|uniref:F-box domain-containing protein n=1 Tax=Tripterygium wilfordii TaxID=458696 RepID=A0A7J7DY47_TRIWF|nr:F-box/kelch-repeat protein At3g06240-like [Tripterygium wilfordii]KAF5751171.1 hypothetical protein HS088_TW02G00181 [Tripterygium wilfordii]